MKRLTRLPPAFLALHASGHLECWRAPGEGPSAQRREARLRSHRQEVLGWRSIRWDRTPEEILASPQVDDGDDLHPGLVPFASTGHGDRYCWYPSWQDGAEPPVILALHDELESALFARDFAECLLRCLLQNYAHPDKHSPSAGEQARLFRAHWAILRPHLRVEQNQLLGQVAQAFSPGACEEAEAQVAARIPSRTLIAHMPPTQYYTEDLTPAETLAAYRKSEAFYLELVEEEGLAQFRPQLEEVRHALRLLGW